MMQKRYGVDSDFILNGDKSVVAVETWAKGLFQSAEVESLKLSKDALEWLLSVAIDAYKKTKDDAERRMIMGKIIHTREVVKAGFDIAIKEREIKWNDFQLGTVCLLHDIARFDQALMGSFSDTNTSFDHGLVGSKMIEEHEFTDFKLLVIDKEIVIEAVKYHNGYQYLGSDNYAKIVRDADKLANLRAMSEILESRVDNFIKEGITEGAVESYREKKMVSNVDIKTRADWLIMSLSWEYDFNYASTGRYFRDEGTRSWMVKELELSGIEI